MIEKMNECWGVSASSDLGDEEPQEPPFKSNQEHIASYTYFQQFSDTC